VREVTEVANARQLRRSVHSHAATGIITSICGWLCALGAASVLTELVSVLGIPLGVGATTNSAMGAQGALLLLAIHLLAYACGGYVAGRSVRSSGALQGVAVWGWSILFATVIAELALRMGDRYNLLAVLNAFPRFTMGEGELSPATLITVVMLWITALIGAVIGGVRGRYISGREPAP
jgi:hypothetical protein